MNTEGILVTEDMYFKLGERLNENPLKWPLDDVFLGILREYYTEAEAALGAVFPLGMYSSRDLARHAGRDALHGPKNKRCPPERRHDDGRPWCIELPSDSWT